MKSLVGEVFAQKYEVLDAIGHGATSVIYKATDLSSGEPVAVKVLHEYLIKKNTTFKRFEQEAQTATLLDHPNIVKIREYVPGEGQPFIVMDYIEGESLASILQREKYIELPRAWKIFIQLADAIDHAHKKGVVHRNLKPGNIIISHTESGDEVAHIADFGVAKLLPSSGQEIQELTQKGSMIGSPLYMSPEQWLGRPVDGRADVYSLGCLMYMLLSGRPPLKGENILGTMAKHLSDIPPGFAQVCPELNISSYAQDIVFKCMAKRPEERYESMDALKLDLLRLQQGKKPRANPVTPPVVAMPPPPKELESKYALQAKIGIGLLLALVVLSVGFIVWVRERDRDTKVTARKIMSVSSQRKVNALSPLALLRQADELRLLKREQEAEIVYRQAIMRASELADKNSENNEVLSIAHTGLADLYRRIGKWTDAEKEYRLALYVESLTPETSQSAEHRIKIDLASCLMHGGQIGEARKMLVDVSQSSTDSLTRVRAYWMRADVEIADHKLDAGEDYLKKALALIENDETKDLDYIAVLSRYEDLLIGKGEIDQAIQILQKSRKSSVRAYETKQFAGANVIAFTACEIARLYCSQGKYADAINLLKETLNYPLHPLRRSAVIDCLAASYFLSGDVKKASSTINDELAKSTGRLGHAASLMRLLIANKQIDKAIHLLEGNTKSGENTPFMKSETYELLALAHLKKGEAEEALKLIDKALAVLKDSSADQLRQECFDLKCRILRALGRADAAEVIEKSTGRRHEKLIPFDDLAPPYQTRVLYN